MFFELMSNGALASLPQTSLPSGTPEFPGPRVVLLLPYNRYLLGYALFGGYDRWVWGKPGGNFQEVFLCDGRQEILVIDQSTHVVLPGDAVTRLRGALLSRMTPPGQHLSTVLILRGMLRSHPVFKEGEPLQNEESFMHLLETDDILKKCYWTVRFSLFRSEFEAVARIKAWLKAGPEFFDAQPLESRARIWFSLLALPREKDLTELESLNFSVDDLQHMVSQNTAPLLLFNPRSGYLILSLLGGSENLLFRAWAFVPTALWGELRENKKLSISDLLLSVWGYQDVMAALDMKERYASPCESTKDALS